MLTHFLTNNFTISYEVRKVLQKHLHIFFFLTTKTYKWASAECLLYKADNLVSLRFSYTKWEITNKEKK